MIHKDIPTNLDFEIINITPMDDYISECEIKVLYTGINRNGSYISKAVGSEIANSLPRSPIVAFYNEQVEDYEDHGEEMIINKDGIKFIRKTVPYGAVDHVQPIVWKQFIAADGTLRDYLMCKGYLWTGRYPHLKSIIENGKGQSMEFFEQSVKGNWTIFPEVDREIFIIDEAKISALCVLGDDVEPCFEGASVSAPGVLYSLKKDDFKLEFNSFMFELNKILKEGSNTVEEFTKTEVDVDVEVITESTIDENLVDENFENSTVETTEVSEEDTKIETEMSLDSEEDTTVEVVEEFTTQDNQTVSSEDYQDLEAKFTALTNAFEELETKFNILNDAEQARVKEAKETVFTKFSEILGDEIETYRSNIDTYTVEEIEDRLSAIAFRKGLSFSNIARDKDFIVVPTNTRSIEDAMPAWIKAVEQKKNKQ